MKQVKVVIEWNLSEDEKTEMAKLGVRLNAEMDQLEAEFKEARADWRRRIEAVKKQRNAANSAYMLGSEMREVIANEVIDWGTRKAAYYVDDKVIRIRDLDPTEQEPMFDAPPQTEVEKEMAAEDAAAKAASKKKQKLNKNGYPIVEQAPTIGVLSK